MVALTYTYCMHVRMYVCPYTGTCVYSYSTLVGVLFCVVTAAVTKSGHLTLHVSTMHAPLHSLDPSHSYTCMLPHILYTGMCTCMHKQAHTHTHAHTRTHTHTHTHTRTHTRTHARAHTHTHTHTRAHARTHHTHTRARTHAHTTHTALTMKSGCTISVAASRDTHTRPVRT